MFSGMLEPFIFFSQALTAKQINLQMLVEDTDSTTWCLSDSDIKKMSFNFSRQRTWRDFIANPQKSIHPVVKSDPSEDDDDEDSDDDDNEVRSITRTVDFVSFSGGKRKNIWTYDLNLKGKYRGCYNMFARFIDDSHWLIIAEVFDNEGDDKMVHVDLKQRKVSSYIFPTCFWAETAFYGLYGSRIYYVREVDNPYCTLSKQLVFGYLQNPDTDDCEENPDCVSYLCFFERGEMTKEALVKIGTRGFVHLALKPEHKKSKVFTFTIDVIEQLMAKSDKLSTKIDFPQESDEETTLPLIKLDELCIEKYEDLSEDLDPEQCDIGFMEGNKLHLLV
ncbi:Oidioi.mRNA.OKI2018_I69.chr2.g7302.t1.cds [Oikopleura dioica]|uniref:Oidioi.mRNA.OKI2018_I69.chr2.g7302.t1.cds n=1 Tax=Oikopleura dioica TaxID=34765 RepID=A0ABN7TAJ0_OIKDI|nr:Oidioi.mRNA.OKI2018_I69.chr2.g7302.t1.cds [Oikopleura dioica]